MKVMATGASSVPSLFDVTLDCLAKNITTVPSLRDVPEDLVVCLFKRVIQQGRLTPRILDVFAASGHPGILDLVSAMRIQSWTPPLLLGNGEAWLGDKSHLW
ncbi:hypothetical protein ACKKBG_A11015 [Auxenochlorella protothecoides x Auxenochlorella symbiontica]